MAPGTAGVAAGTAGTPPSPHGLRFDTGRPCLDLLATTHPEEHLLTAASLCAWITGAGLVPPGTPLTDICPTWLAPFRELRACTGRLIREGPREGPCEAPYEGLPGATVPYDLALTRLNAYARPAPPAPRVLRADDGTLVRALHAPPTCAALLAAVARDAVELLTDPVARAGLRQCEGDHCPLVYLDTSRGRRRRWCSSEVCGNRERVARHRRRAALARA